MTEETRYEALRVLYDMLLAHAPSVGVAVGRAAALIEGGDLAGGATALDALEEGDVNAYQPYWVVRARLAELRGDEAAMRSALEHALCLTEDEAVRRFLEDRLARAGQGGG